MSTHSSHSSRALRVIKFGGAIVDDAQLRSRALRSVADVVNNNERCIVVHGGGEMASALLRQLGVEPMMVEGRRITDEYTLRIVTMVYAGLINTSLVAELQSLGCNAVGMRGCDDDVIRSRKRSGSHIDYGFVGDIEYVRADRLLHHGEEGRLPVLAPITHDGKGQLLNTNADTVAAEVAMACAESCDVEVIYCFAHNGVLRDKNDPTSVINELDIAEMEEMKQSGAADGGMVAKLQNAAALAARGIDVRICSVDDYHGGTRIRGVR